MRTILALTLTGLLAHSLTGLAAPGQVKCSWDSNVETNVAGYRVLWGPASQRYNRTNVVLGVENNTVTVQLPNGVSYLVVQAFGFDGADSPFSYEVAWTNTPIAAPRNFKVSAVIQTAATTNGPWHNLARAEVNLPQGGEAMAFRSLLDVKEDK